MTTRIIVPAALASVVLLGGCAHGTALHHTHATVVFDGSRDAEIVREVRVIRRDAPGVRRRGHEEPPAAVPAHKRRFLTREAIARRARDRLNEREYHRQRRRKERGEEHTMPRTRREHRDAAWMSDRRGPHSGSPDRPKGPDRGRSEYGHDRARSTESRGHHGTGRQENRKRSEYGRSRPVSTESRRHRDTGREENRHRREQSHTDGHGRSESHRRGRSAVDDRKEHRGAWGRER
jgi:hypothetical protein